MVMRKRYAERGGIVSDITVTMASSLRCEERVRIREFMGGALFTNVREYSPAVPGVRQRKQAWVEAKSHKETDILVYIDDLSYFTLQYSFSSHQSFNQVSIRLPYHQPSSTPNPVPRSSPRSKSSYTRALGPYLPYALYLSSPSLPLCVSLTAALLSNKECPPSIPQLRGILKRS